MYKVLIAQARFGSSRLPGKVLYPIAGRPMLAHVIDRLRAVRRADLVVVATSYNPVDDIVADWAKVLETQVFRGSEEDVLSRYVAASKHYKADLVVRVCCDAPLIDPVVIDRAIEQYLEHRDSVDYVSNMMTRTFPRGQSVEVIRPLVLEELDIRAADPHQREHVTPYLLENPTHFRVSEYLNSIDLSGMNWTVDTRDDLLFVREVYNRLYKPGKIFGMSDVLRLLEANPELAAKGSIK
ncbi:MAG: NTP transferase domain-containing protein [Phycisphaerae bacterium]|nr:NTP transferase domain-containing protein [Phycisphaerae bacterium]